MNLNRQGSSLLLKGRINSLGYKIKPNLEDTELPQKDKFRREIPCNNYYDHAVRMDKKNGDYLCADYIKLEIDQQH